MNVFALCVVDSQGIAFPDESLQTNGNPLLACHLTKDLVFVDCRKKVVL
jgi:hypothetical protein